MILHYVGVDPGQKGGLAVVARQDDKPVAVVQRAVPMPVTKVNGKASLDTMALDDFFPHQPFVAVLEQVHAMPGQGVSSMFQFGRMYGAIEAVLDSSAAEIMYVPARKWKSFFRLGSDKRDAIMLADQKFGPLAMWHVPGRGGGLNVDRNSGVAEAALLGLYGVYHCA